MTALRKSTLAKNAYEGYCKATEWKSLISGDTLPDWEVLKPAIQAAWESAVANLFVMGSDGNDYLIDDPPAPG
jgi:hypothetical protein